MQHDGFIAANGSYTAEATFALSPEISGRYVIVVANTGGIVINPNADPLLDVEVGSYLPPTWEGPCRDNNLGVGSTYVAPLPPADLQVTAVVGSAPNYSGESATVTWTVRNFGAPAWSGTRYWLDSAYVSRYPTFRFDTATLLGEFPHSNDQPLATGGSYTLKDYSIGETGF